MLDLSGARNVRRCPKPLAFIIVVSSLLGLYLLVGTTQIIQTMDKHPTKTTHEPQWGFMHDLEIAEGQMSGFSQPSVTFGYFDVSTFVDPEYYGTNACGFTAGPSPHDAGMSVKASRYITWGANTLKFHLANLKPCQGQTSFDNHILIKFSYLVNSPAPEARKSGKGVFEAFTIWDVRTDGNIQSIGMLDLTSSASSHGSDGRARVYVFEVIKRVNNDVEELHFRSRGMSYVSQPEVPHKAIEFNAFGEAPDDARLEQVQVMLKFSQDYIENTSRISAFGRLSELWSSACGVLAAISVISGIIIICQCNTSRASAILNGFERQPWERPSGQGDDDQAEVEHDSLVAPL